MELNVKRGMLNPPQALGIERDRAKSLLREAMEIAVRDSIVEGYPYLLTMQEVGRLCNTLEEYTFVIISITMMEGGKGNLKMRDLRPINN